MKVGIIGSAGLMGQRRKAHLDPEDECRGCDIIHRGSVPETVAWADALIVAVPHDQLAPIAFKCVEAGKHVLLEKPCATTPDELKKVAEMAKRTGAVVVPGFTLRHYPGIEKAFRIVAEHDPLIMRSVYGHPGRRGYENEWRCDKLRGGGQLLDQGIHLIDLACKMFDFSEDNFRDYAETSGEWSSVEDNVLIHMGAGPLATLHASWTEPVPIFRLEVTFRGGGGCRVEGLGGGYGHHRFRQWCSSTPRAHDETVWEDPRSAALTREWQHFKECVKSSKSLIDDAVRALNVAECCKLRHDHEL
jgi:predicted dehydrogenase